MCLINLFLREKCQLRLMLPVDSLVPWLLHLFINETVAQTTFMRNLDILIVFEEISLKTSLKTIVKEYILIIIF